MSLSTSAEHIHSLERAMAALQQQQQQQKNMIYCQVLGKYHISYVCIHVKGI